MAFGINTCMFWVHERDHSSCVHVYDVNWTLQTLEWPLALTHARFEFMKGTTASVLFTSLWCSVDSSNIEMAFGINMCTFWVHERDHSFCVVHFYMMFSGLFKHWNGLWNTWREFMKRTTASVLFTSLQCSVDFSNIGTCTFWVHERNHSFCVVHFYMMFSGLFKHWNGLWNRDVLSY